MSQGSVQVQGTVRSHGRDLLLSWTEISTTKIDLLFENYQNRILKIFKVNMTGSIASNWIFMSIRERNPILHLRVVGVFVHMAVII